MEIFMRGLEAYPTLSSNTNYLVHNKIRIIFA